MSELKVPTGGNDGVNSRINRAFIFGIGLNLAFTLVEFAAGIHYDSLALLSDAAHNLSDVGSLLISLAAYRLSRVAPTKRFTFGLGKTTILASLVNAVILLIVTGGIISEAIQRFSEPRSTEGMVIVVVAGIGIVINTLSAALFFRDKSSDLNMKGAYLHLAIDAVVSLGVVISGLVIFYTGWLVIDPMISMVIAAVIIVSTWSLFRESLRLTTDAVPEGINHDEVLKSISSVKGVKDVHHVHIWAISTTMNSLTAHIVTSNEITREDMVGIKEEIRKRLRTLNIDHATLETEPSAPECHNQGC
ncbi:MAG: cation transporter [Bacteroidales bacterium]|nr:cation transporter [Bacteroidales bacterium]